MLLARKGYRPSGQNLTLGTGVASPLRLELRRFLSSMRTSKLRQFRPMMLGDLGFEKFLAACLQPLERAGLVRLHVPAE